MNTTLENEEPRKWIDMMDQSQKVTIIDAQVRLVREVDGSIEHVTWFIDVDRLTDFMQTHFNKQTRWGLFFFVYWFTYRLTYQ